MEPIICSPSGSGQQSTIALTVASTNGDLLKSTFLNGGSFPCCLPRLKEHLTPVVNGNKALISHADFVEIARDVTYHIFRGEKITAPLICVSHPVYKSDANSTLMLARDKESGARPEYFQCMAFVIELPSIDESIGRDNVHMCLGGVSSMDERAFLLGAGQRLQLFAGFTVRGSRNTCVFREGLIPGLWIKEPHELRQAVYNLLCEYDACDQLRQLERMLHYSLSEQQFAHFLGKARLYELLPSQQKARYPELLFTDYQLQQVAEGYLQDRCAGSEKVGSISLWKLYNLLLSANKQSHIDLFLPRGANASSLIAGMATALERRRKHWFLS